MSPCSAPRSPRALSWLLLATVLVLSLAPLRPAVAQDATPQAGGRLVFAASQEPNCWDPQISAADATAAVVRTVVDSLVAQLPSGEIVPWLATSWTVNETVTQYTFELQSGVTFSDGTPFDADAVKYNFDRIVNPATGSQYAISLLGPYDSTTVVDADTVEVNFKEPFSPFLQATSQPQLGMLSPTATAAADLCAPIVGSGPYVIAQVNPAESVILARNEQYSSPSPLSNHEGVPYLDEIEFRFIPDDAVRVGSLSSDQVDAAGGVPPKDIKTLEDDDYTLFKADRPGAPYQIFINTQAAPWNDVRVRQALQKSLDINGIVETLYLGYYQRAWSPLSQPTVGFDGSLVDSWPQDVNAANALLDEAGWAWNGDFREKDGQPLVARWQFISTGREQRELVAQLVKEQAKAVGIDVQIETLPIAEYLTKIQSGDYDLGEFSFVRSSPDILRNLFVSTNIPSAERIAQNYSRVSDPEIDSLLASTTATLDPAAQAAAYAQVQQWVITNAVTVPVYVQAELTVASDKVQGITFDTNGFPIFYDTWVQQ